MSPSSIFFLVTFLLVLTLTHAHEQNFAKDSKELLSKRLHEVVQSKGLKMKSNLLNDDKATLHSKSAESLLSGHKQRMNHHTPAGSSFNGFKMTPLDDYVSRPDSHYRWSEFDQYYDEFAFDVHFLNVTSQKWLDENTVSRSVWWHIVAVIRPLDYNVTDNAIMYITGHSNPAPGHLPELKDEGILLGSILAVETGSLAIVQWQIPNEHLEFYDEKPTPQSRTEDAIIAYTWDHFLDHPDQPDWLLRNPMVKGSVRALDAVEEYVKQKWNNSINRWTVCGASKRGWTTWILAAYDQAHEKRIVGFMPMVESFINMRKQFHRWWRIMGSWSFALKDYWNMNFTTKFDGPNADKMGQVIDPLTYFDRYANIPLMQIMSSGDEFFSLGDPSLYWDKIPGEKYLLICQNAEHSLSTSLLDLIPSMGAFYKSIIHNTKRPQVSWKLDPANNKIVMESDVPVSVAKSWLATTFSKKRIDFRVIRKETEEDPCEFPKVKGLCPQPIAWLPTHATSLSPTRYEAHFAPPDDGRWISFFIQFQYTDQGAGTTLFPHIFTSQAIILPDTEPFPDCNGDACKGKLI